MAAQVSNLAGELAGAATGEVAFSPQPVPQARDDRALDALPDTLVDVADVEQAFAGSKMLRRSAREANGEAYLLRAERGDDLVQATL